MESALVDLIYESSFAPERWTEVLNSLANMVDAPIGSLILFSQESSGLWKGFPDAHPGLLRFVNEGWLFRGRFGALIRDSNYPGFAVENDAFTPEQLDEEPVYRDFFRPQGFGWAAGTVIRIPGAESVFVTLNRRYERGPIERDLVEKLNGLRPHLARGALISARLQFERARAASETLAIIGLPALVFDEQGKVLAANALIQSQTDCIRWRAKDRISLKDAAADKLLRDAVENFRRQEAQPTCSFPLRDSEANAAKVAHIIPIRRSARDIFVRSAAVLVLTPIAAPDAPPVELVQSLFDLTPAQARVARSLAAGNSLDDIASGSGVSINTVRTQLRGVLEKTGCRRQAEVVALLAGIAPLAV